MKKGGETVRFRASRSGRSRVLRGESLACDVSLDEGGVAKREEFQTKTSQMIASGLVVVFATSRHDYNVLRVVGNLSH